MRYNWPSSIKSPELGVERVLTCAKVVNKPRVLRSLNRVEPGGFLPSWQRPFKKRMKPIWRHKTNDVGSPGRDIKVMDGSRRFPPLKTSCYSFCSISRCLPFRKCKGFSLEEESGFRFPAGSKLWEDTGFQGYEPEGSETYQPKKKPRGGELTEEEKEQNRDISRVRIRVEHSIGGVKAFHIVRDVYRNHKQHFEDLIMETACGLHNLRLDYPMSA